MAKSRTGFNHIPPPNSSVTSSAANFHINTRTNNLSDILTLSSTKCKSLLRLTDNNIPHNIEDIYLNHKIPRAYQRSIDRFTINDAPFNDRLHRIDPLIPPKCPHCTSLDSLHHRIMTCPRYAGPRRAYIQNIRSIPSFSTTPLSLRLLLGQSPGTKADRATLILSLCGYLKSTDLVLTPRQMAPTNPPEPP